MLKYVDLYRYSDGVALIGHRHNRTGPPQLRPCAPHASFAERGRYKAGPTVHGGEGARPHASMPCFVVPWTLQSINRHTRCSRPLGYELTSDSFMLIRLSQTCTSPSISRLYHPSPFHMIYGLARRFVHKSVHNRARSSCVRLAGRLVTITMPNTRSWTTEAFTARHVPRWNWLSNKASCIATPRVDNRHSHEKLLRFHQMNQGRRAGVQLVAAVLL